MALLPLLLRAGDGKNLLLLLGELGKLPAGSEAAVELALGLAAWLAASGRLGGSAGGIERARGSGGVAIVGDGVVEARWFLATTVSMCGGAGEASGVTCGGPPERTRPRSDGCSVRDKRCCQPSCATGVRSAAGGNAGRSCRGEPSGVLFGDGVRDRRSRSTLKSEFISERAVAAPQRETDRCAARKAPMTPPDVKMNATCSCHVFTALRLFMAGWQLRRNSGSPMVHAVAIRIGMTMSGLT